MTYVIELGSWHRNSHLMFFAANSQENCWLDVAQEKE